MPEIEDSALEGILFPKMVTSLTWRELCVLTDLKLLLAERTNPQGGFSFL